MRKKALIEQNLSLFSQVEALRGENAVKQKRIEELENEVKRLKDLISTEKSDTTVPLKRLEEKVLENSKHDSGLEYASEVIGKLVVESAEGCNKLTAGGNTGNRELVNLLLGKTEVAKAEILSVVSEDCDYSEKKRKIDNVAAEAKDYFTSVLAQIQ